MRCGRNINSIVFYIQVHQTAHSFFAQLRGGQGIYALKIAFIFDADQNALQQQYDDDAYGSRIITKTMMNVEGEELTRNRRKRQRMYGGGWCLW
jgi:hypothetical protein